MAVALSGACSQGKDYRDEKITMEAFSALKTPAFAFDLDEIRALLRQLCEERGGLTGDASTRRYYQETSSLLWVDRNGVDRRADSLLSCLRRVGSEGLSGRAFLIDDIERDLRRFRALDFTAEETVNKVAARLEFHLTKACMRYAYGQRYGFVNPGKLFNNLDIESQDTIRNIVNYRGLFGADMETAPSGYDSLVRGKIAAGEIADYLRSVQPQDPMYLRLREMLAAATTAEERRRILCNMERCRWRLTHPIPDKGKYVVVNIPAYHLYAHDGDSVLDMRVVCGAVSTKTPLLTSYVEWMEVNPQWVIPASIVQCDVVRHAGDSAYFARNRYDVYERATNRQIAAHRATREMLLSGKYRVAQQSGADNALGRIVFRFKNPFQVFLHYTSNPGAFQRASRAMSHGCVRVARPFELASFLLTDPDEWLLDRIRISMDLQPETEQGMSYLRRNPEQKEHKLVSYVPVKPRVPLYIIYNTLWPDEHGQLRTWPDVYGYDKVLWDSLKPFMP